MTDILTGLQWQKEDDGIVRTYEDSQHFGEKIIAQTETCKDPEGFVDIVEKSFKVSPNKKVISS